MPSSDEATETMHSREESAGLIIVCDAQTVIRDVIRDDFGLVDHLEPRRSFATLIDGGCLEQARRFLGTINTHGVAFNWSLDVDCHGKAARLRFAGTTAAATGILIVAAHSGGEIGDLCKRLLESGESQVKMLRSAARALVRQAESAPTGDRDLHEKLVRANEELLAARRALDEKDAELARLHAREGRAHEALHQAYLPLELPELAGAKFHAVHAAGTRDAKGGGAWYDAFALPDRRVGVSLGDAGGLRAAAAAAQVRDFIRLLALEGHAPFMVLSRVSRVLQRAAGLIPEATALFGLLDPGAVTFSYATAGHPPPILRDPDRGVIRLASGGPPLGARDVRLYPSWTVALSPGSLLVLHTKGLLGDPQTTGNTTGVLLDAILAGVPPRPPDYARAIRDLVLESVRPPNDVAVLTVSIDPAGGARRLPDTLDPAAGGGAP